MSKATTGEEIGNPGPVLGGSLVPGWVGFSFLRADPHAGALGGSALRGRQRGGPGGPEASRGPGL